MPCHKCCVNCRYHYGCLGTEEGYYHIHDYCSLWHTEMTNPSHSVINSFLDDSPEIWYIKDVNEQPEAFRKDPGIYDDHETGESYCYRFEPISEDDIKLGQHLTPEEVLKEHFEHNKQIALFVIDRILKSGKHINQFEKYTETPIDDVDIKYYTDMRKQIEECNWEN